MHGKQNQQKSMNIHCDQQTEGTLNFVVRGFKRTENRHKEQYQSLLPTFRGH